MTSTPRPVPPPPLEAMLADSQDRIYWLCLRLVGRPELAAELTQETMLVACRKIDEFRGESSFHTWLHGIARNLCLRSRERKAELLDDDGVLDATDPARGVLASMRVKERDDLLDEARQAVLDGTEQEVLHLRYALGMGYEEITQLLGLTEESGARGVLQRCKRKLRRELERLLVERGHGTSLVFGSIGQGE
jgi:RNA polymerase sigma-70 factor (ECF subfamily)